MNIAEAVERLEMMESRIWIKGIDKKGMVDNN